MTENRDPRIFLTCIAAGAIGGAIVGWLFLFLPGAPDLRLMGSEFSFAYAGAKFGAVTGAIFFPIAYATAGRHQSIFRCAIGAMLAALVGSWAELSYGWPILLLDYPEVAAWISDEEMIAIASAILGLAMFLGVAIAAALERRTKSNSAAR